jgi:plasmid stabilization system protein ParE
MIPCWLEGSWIKTRCGAESIDSSRNTSPERRSGPNSLYSLSEEAADDLLRILDESMLQWGAAAARRMQARLEARFARIAAGITPGHKRLDVARHLPLRFAVEPPFVIAFNPEKRQIVRIVHGRRDFSTLF